MAILLTEVINARAFRNVDFDSDLCYNSKQKSRTILTNYNLQLDEGGRTLNFRNIEYFLAISEEQNISKAAERLHISQQSLSEQLKKMEIEVGTPLVKRGRVITLTPAGEIFKGAGEELIDIYKKTLDKISLISEKGKTTITLAIPTTETPQFLAGLLTEFSAECPEYKIKIVTCRPKEAAKMADDFDLYFSTLPLGSDLEHIPLLDCGTYAAAFTPDLAYHVFGDRWKEIEAELLRERNIAVLREMPFIFLLNHAGEVVLDYQLIFQDTGFEPKIAFQSANSELNANMCSLGTGVYLSTLDRVNHCFQSGSKNGDILIYPIDTNISPVTVTLSYRKRKKLTKAERCFINVTKEYLKKYVT